MASCFYCGWPEGDGHYDGCVKQADETLAAKDAEIARLRKAIFWVLANARVESSPFDGCPYVEWPGQTWNFESNPEKIVATVCRLAEEG